MPRVHEIRIQRDAPLSAEPHTGHNRWHPDLLPVLNAAEGDEVLLETRDALDGLVTPYLASSDIPKLDLTRVHPLTGPIFVSGAAPGDLLEIEILDIIPEPFGYTFLLPGTGLLKHHFPDPFLVTWEIRDGYAVSSQLNGVRVPGTPFMGVMGVAPSRELLRLIHRRELELTQKGVKVSLPSERGAIPLGGPPATEGLRTAPPRENGGNLDIRQLTKGSSLFLPVFTEGALFSAGDAHFAQGDSECCGTAIEMGATLAVRFHVHPKAAARGICFRPKMHSESRTTHYHATVGTSIRPDGQIEPGNLSLAAENATLRMIDYLVETRGFNREQAYVLTSVAADLRISEIVNHPNVVVSAFLPLDIFTA
jgi:formamidase